MPFLVSSPVTPTPKPILRIQPKLRVSHPPVEKQTPPLQKPAQAPPAEKRAPQNIKSAESATASEGGSAVSDESLVKTVPQVVGAIQQISNYFGSTFTGHSTELEGCPKEKSGQSQLQALPQEKAGHLSDVAPESNKGHTSTGAVGQSAPQHGSTAIGQLSHESIGRLAGEIAEQLVQDGDDDGDDNGDIPSYAPEKCIAGYSGEGDGKGSPVELAPLLAKGGVSKLENILVSEKDIFGAPLPEGMDDSSEDEDMGDTADMGDTIGDIAYSRSDHWDMEVGDGEVKTRTDTGSNLPVSDGPSEAEMRAEFRKLTSLSGQLKDSIALSEELKDSVNSKKCNVCLCGRKRKEEEGLGKYM